MADILGNESYLLVALLSERNYHPSKRWERCVLGILVSPTIYASSLFHPAKRLNSSGRKKGREKRFKSEYDHPWPLTNSKGTKHPCGIVKTVSNQEDEVFKPVAPRFTLCHISACWKSCTLKIKVNMPQSPFEGNYKS